MLFNSWNFLACFLPITLGIALCLRGQWLLFWITLSSYVFYALFGEAWFLIPMFVTTVLDFFLAPCIAAASSPFRRRLFLGISVCGNLGLLIYFKYSGLLLRSAYVLWHVFGLSGQPGAWTAFLITFLPPGISFYTFQTLSYVIDVYRGNAHPERNFLKFASFVSFFPHLVAGPLTRHNQLLPALDRIKREGIDPRWNEGIYLFAVGLIKKTLLADRIATLIDPMLTHTRLPALSSWLCLLGFSLQIYFDFSGYSDMAIGTARLFGIELPQNFNSPYQAVNPRDFWKRWHITLSLWLRDYLYIPLGGNRFTKSRQFFSLILTMFLGGLWHGAQWTFAVWGLFHGALLVLYHFFRNTWDRQSVALQRSLTFFLISLGWIFFRADNFSQAAGWWADLFGATGGFHIANSDQLKLLGYVVGGLVVVNAFPNASSYPRFAHLRPSWQVGLGALTVVALLFMNYSSNFLYFQF